MKKCFTEELLNQAKITSARTGRLYLEMDLEGAEQRKKAGYGRVCRYRTIPCDS